MVEKDNPEEKGEGSYGEGPEEQGSGSHGNESSGSEALDSGNNDAGKALPRDSSEPGKPGQAPAQSAEQIRERDISKEMKQSYLDYSMSVIVGRALPDARDGLKPVHRRILYAMSELGMTHDKPFKKSARIVGEVLGKYHPHGDSSVYDAMVRMVQDFSMRYPLVEGQGNFGSIDGDNAAAMRYTEARLRKLSEEMLSDIDKDTVDFMPNFDNSLKEPTVLPSKIPNLLINGSSGIAVGMATNIPPHNLGEVCDAVAYAIDHPDCSPEDLMQHIKGPDFPTAGIIQGIKGIRTAYSTGRGRCIIKARTHFEGEKKRKLVVTEIPYMVNKANLVESIADLVKTKRIEGITDLRDESDKEGLRIVIELRHGTNEEIVLNQLLKHTRLQDSFGIIFLTLVGNRPVILNIKGMIEQFIKHRFEIVTRQTQFELKQARQRMHILEGLLIALDKIDEIVEKIKKSRDAREAASLLMGDYSLTEIQAKAILELRLQKLASLEMQKIRDEHQETGRKIKGLEAILADDGKVYTIIKTETKGIRDSFGDKRRTVILEGGDEDYEIDMEDMIDQEDVIITVSHQGYIKRIPAGAYREQKRGGKGVRATSSREEDFIEDLFVANTHEYMLFFTNLGKVHWLKVYMIPEASRTARGTAIVNLLELEKDENVTAFVNVKEFRDGYVVMATRKGTIKKCELKLFSKPRKGGIRAISLEEGDSLIEAKLTAGDEQLILATRDGKAIKFHEKHLRPIGRAGMGVRGIKLKEKDNVVGMVIADDSQSLLTVTENGYGKRSKIADYRFINRGGSGVINIICSQRNGKVAAVKSVAETDSLIMISQKGIAIRVSASDISIIGRNTQGVRIMKLSEGDRLAACARIVAEDEEAEGEA